MKKVKLITLILLPMLLGSCNNKVEESKTSEEISSESSIVTLTTESVHKGGTYGGYFTEMDVGRRFSSNSRYEFTFESSYAADLSFTVKSSRPDSATIEMGTGTKFYINTHAAGDTIITINNAQDMLCYREVLRVRDPYDKDTIIDAMFNEDYFQSWSYLGDWKLTVTNTNPIEAVMLGGDDWEQDKTINFTLEYDEYITETDCHCFDITVSSTNSETQLTHLCIARCADVIYMYYSTGGEEHLLTMLFPKSLYSELMEYWG